MINIGSGSNGGMMVTTANRFDGRDDIVVGSW